MDKAKELLMFLSLVNDMIGNSYLNLPIYMDEEVNDCLIKMYFVMMVTENHSDYERLYNDFLLAYHSLNDKQQEHFYCLYLDNSKRVIKDKLLFIGTINYSVVHPREIFKEAYMLSASSIICVHNHPTGNVLPSKQDLTNNLINIGNIMGIKVIDHVIIGQNNYYSFLENGDI